MPTTDPAYFDTLPGCAALLADPEYMVVPSRFGKPMKNGRGEFFTTTLATNSTIKACVYQTRRTARSHGFAPPQGIVSEARALIDTASGINGFPGVSHGGFVAAIIDEVMGFLINSYHRSAATETAATEQPVPMTAPGSSVMTAELTTKYRKPVPSGEALVVTAWIERVEGRKMFVQATIQAAEETDVVLAEGFALFIALRPGMKGPAVRRRAAAAAAAKI